MRQKKPSLLRGIGHMFRFGKHRKDGIAPVETLSDFGAVVAERESGSKKDFSKFQTLPPQQQSTSGSHHGSQSRQMKIQAQLNSSMRHNDRKAGGGGGAGSSSSGPPMYQPPPPVSGASGVGIHKQDLFNHRYSHYVNYEELQQQIR